MMMQTIPQMYVHSSQIWQICLKWNTCAKGYWMIQCCKCSVILVDNALEFCVSFMSTWQTFLGKALDSSL